MKESQNDALVFRLLRISTARLVVEHKTLSKTLQHMKESQNDDLVFRLLRM